MSRFWTYLIAILEIVGGIYGFAFTAWRSVTDPPDRHNVPFAIIILVIYLFSLIAGVTLALGSRFGRVASIIVQAIQLPKFISPLLIFMFSLGFDAYVYGWLTSNAQPVFGFEFKFLAFDQLFVNVVDAPAGFGISISACAFLVMLLRKPKVAPPDGPPATDTDAPNKSLDASRGSVFRMKLL